MVFENWIFLHDPSSVPKHVLPLQPASHPSRELIEKWMHQDSFLNATTRSILNEAKSRDIHVAIALGEEYLKHQPEDCHFRGHLAHWYISIKNEAKAIHHYRILAEQQPNNTDLHDILSELER